MIEPNFQFSPPNFIVENWQSIEKDYLTFVLTQGEKRLAETNKTADSITTRAYILLSISISAVTLLVGYLISHTMHDQNQNIYVLSSYIALLFFVVIFSQLYKILIPYGIEVPGSEPKLYLQKEFIDGFDEAEQIKNALLCECTSYQVRINANQLTNKERLRNFNSALYGLAFSPLSLLISWVLFQLA